MASLKWGVLGAARIAREQVVPAIQRSGTGEVVAVSSASGRAAEFAAAAGIGRHYGSHEELLADPEVQAVYVPLPNAAHAAWTEAAATAGKHVLCEKPIVLSSAELARVEEAARGAGVHVAEAFMYRHHPQLARVRELIADGAVGDVVALQARLHFALERTSEPDIRLRADLGGGSLRDLGCYPVDLFGTLLDAEPDEVRAVAVREGAGEPDAGSGVDRRLSASLRYGDVVASLDCSFDVPFTNTATVLGTRGRLSLTDAFRADRQLEGAGTLVLERDGERSEEQVPGDQYAAEVAAFAEAVAGAGAGSGARDWDTTVRTVRTVERIAEAAGLPGAGTEGRA
ncbi:Gfo/Idh/MocA family protein [Ornithinicoccus halotolerans]|uniref:Gfo/Idh/MocA family protein n=1 Tax=Ornithinicoccus halotolerans TaxID=1748220 RepID=UPI001297BEE2|nr:Gfo/Idh/MocA family oxidoreductase [Ornithinicoccus halotolerans]